MAVQIKRVVSRNMIEFAGAPTLVRLNAWATTRCRSGDCGAVNMASVSIGSGE